MHCFSSQWEITPHTVISDSCWLGLLFCLVPLTWSHNRMNVFWAKHLNNKRERTSDCGNINEHGNFSRAAMRWKEHCYYGMFSLLPVYHRAKSLDKGFSAWYKMLSNAVVQYLVSRADLKEMASTIKQNNTPPPMKSGRQVQQRVVVWYTVIITALLFHRADFYLDWISAIRILYVYTCLCARVCITSLQGEPESLGGAGRV